MKFKAILISLFIIVTLGACAEEKVDPQQLLKNFNKAVEDKSIEQMESLILSKEGVEDKHIEAMANIYIKMLGGDFKTILQANAEKSKLVNTKRVDYLMRGTVPFSMFHPKTIIPKGKLVKEDGKEYVKLTEHDITQSLLLKSVGGTTKFWPKDIEPNNDLIKVSHFLNDYFDVLNNTPINKYPEAFNKIVDQYVPATTLEYKDQPIKAEITGEEKTAKFVLVDKTTFRGKEVLKIRFLTEGPKDKCGKFSPKIFSISVPNDGNSSYDFAKTGITGSLMKLNYTNSIRDGKISLEKVDENTYKGKIAAEKDGENYIYGNFTAEICN